MTTTPTAALVEEAEKMAFRALDGTASREEKSALFASLAAALRRAEAERDEARREAEGWIKALRDEVAVRTREEKAAIEEAAKRAQAEAERDAQHEQVLRLTAERDAVSVVHACPPKGSGVMPCCGATPFEKQGERLTMDPALVNCDRQRLIAENARLQREHDAYCRKQLANYGLTVAGRLQRELDAVRAENDTLHYLLRGGQ